MALDVSALALGAIEYFLPATSWLSTSAPWLSAHWACQRGCIVGQTGSQRIRRQYRIKKAYFACDFAPIVTQDQRELRIRHGPNKRMLLCKCERRNHNSLHELQLVQLSHANTLHEVLKRISAHENDKCVRQGSSPIQQFVCANKQVCALHTNSFFASLFKT